MTSLLHLGGPRWPGRLLFPTWCPIPKGLEIKWAWSSGLCNKPGEEAVFSLVVYLTEELRVHPSARKTTDTLVEKSGYIEPLL